MLAISKRKRYLLGWAIIALFAAISVGIVLLGAQRGGLPVYTAAGVALSLFISVWTYHSTHDVFHPLAFFTIAYMLFAVGLQLYVPVFGIPSGFEVELAGRGTAYPQLVAMLPLGVLGLLLGVKITDRFGDRPSFQRFDAFAFRLSRVELRLDSVALFCMLAGTAILWYQWLQRGGIAALLEQYGQNQYTYDSSYYFSLLAQFLWIPGFLLYAGETLRSPRGVAKIVLSAVPFLLPVTVYGIRFLLLIAILGAVMAWHVRVRRITFARIMVVAIPLLAGLSVLGQFRGTRSTDLLELSLRGVMQEALGPGAGAGAITMVITELVPSILPYQYGGTYISAILNLVPGFVFGSAGRPFFNPSLAFHDIYSPGLVDHGFGFSMTAEAYMNWGVWGALPTLFLVGLVLGVSYRYLLARRDSYSIAIYTMVVFESLWYLRADSTTYVKAILLPILVMKLISLFAGSRRRSRDLSSDLTFEPRKTL